MTPVPPERPREDTRLNADTFNYQLAVLHLNYELQEIGETVVLTPEARGRIAERIRQERRAREIAMDGVGVEYPEMRRVRGSHVD